MGLRIQNNIAALNTHRNLVNADRGLSRSLERLSSGFRINKASDDSAGLAISMRFRAQIRSLTQGASNASQAQSLLQVAEGAADQVTNILQRMKELATQAASSNTGSNDRTKINNEITDLEEEIDRIVNSTKYGGTTLIDGTFGSNSISAAGNLATGSLQIRGVDVSGATAGASYSVTIATGAGTKTMTIELAGAATQSIEVDAGDIIAGTTQVLDFDTAGIGIKVTVGDTYDVTTTEEAADALTVVGSATEAAFQVGNENNSDNQISFSLTDLNLQELVSGGLSVEVDTLSGAQAALTDIDTAIDTVATARAGIGSVQNRMGFASANIATSIENLTAAESVIRDADLAFETVAFTKNQILLQAGVAMLAQANAAPQAVLSLLG